MPSYQYYSLKIRGLTSKTLNLTPIRNYFAAKRYALIILMAFSTKLRFKSISMNAWFSATSSTLSYRKSHTKGASSELQFGSSGKRFSDMEQPLLRFMLPHHFGIMRWLIHDARSGSWWQEGLGRDGWIQTCESHFYPCKFMNLRWEYLPGSPGIRPC